MFLFYNVSGVGTGVMKFFACTVAKIFIGVIMNWNYVDIVVDFGLILFS